MSSHTSVSVSDDSDVSALSSSQPGGLNNASSVGSAAPPPQPGIGVHSIYKLQGRNPDLTIAEKGNARKKIVSTLAEKTDEHGNVWHQYYHCDDPNNLWWFKEQALINEKGASDLNKRLQAFYHDPDNNVKTTAAARESNKETQQHIAAAEASLAAAMRSAARTDGELGGTGVPPPSISAPVVVSGVSVISTPPADASQQSAAPAADTDEFTITDLDYERLADLAQAAGVKTYRYVVSARGKRKKCRVSRKKITTQLCAKRPILPLETIAAALSITVPTAITRKGKKRLAKLLAIKLFEKSGRKMRRVSRATR